MFLKMEQCFRRMNSVFEDGTVFLKDEQCFRRMNSVFED